MVARSPSIRARLLVLAICWAIIGGFGTCGSAVLLIPAWQVANGGGHTGTFTLTEPTSCDRYQPPRQRCGWFGDFVSHDRKAVRRHIELAGGLARGAKIGDTLRASDTGSLAQIYRTTDRRSWKRGAGFLAGFSAFFMVGMLILLPWSRWLGASHPPRGAAGGTPTRSSRASFPGCDGD
jgi:hypothetical protein